MAGEAGKRELPEEALTDHAKVVKLIVDKWFADTGYGFGRAPTGEVVFIQASVVQGAEVLVVGTEAWTQVVRRKRGSSSEGCQASNPRTRRNSRKNSSGG